MPVIILIGEAIKFESDLEQHFKQKYAISIQKDAFLSIRLSLGNQDSNTLYIVSNVDKPGRYEIFCLARKNEQQFLSICTKDRKESASSDKNLLLLDEFDACKIEEELEKSKLSRTSAGKRSKCLILKNLSEAKSLFNVVNSEYLSKHGNIEFIITECEERMIKIVASQPQLSLDEIVDCYKNILACELKQKGFV